MRETKASMRSAKSLLFSFFIGIFFLLITGTPSFAQSNLPQSKLAPNVPETQHTIIHTLTNDVLSSLTCMVIGFDPNTPTNQCLIYDKRTDSYTYASESEFGLVGTMLAGLPLMLDIPIHTADYTTYVASNFGVKSTHAQIIFNNGRPGDTGTGNQQLAPLLPFWLAMRNIVYLLYVIAFVVVGAGIMLRLKMDPRTVMSIQNQIPRIIISILLVTFSYAISGIMIDAMYVSIYTVYSIANRIDVYDNPASKDAVLDTQDDIFGQNPLDFVNNMFSILGISFSTGSEGARVISNLILPREWAGTIETDTGTSIPIISGLVGAVKSIAGIVIGDIFNIFKVLIAAVAGFAASIILPLIIGVAILVSLFKLWFTLIKAYVIIIINIIIAPFWIFLGVFPGSKVNFESWLRQLIAYLLVFPATILLFIFAKLISISFAKNAGEVYFAPPLIGTFSGLETLSNLVAFGVILIGPILLDQLIIVMKAPTAGAISKAVIGGFQEGRSWEKKGRGAVVGLGAKALFYKNRPPLALGAAPNAALGQSEGAGRAFARNLFTQFENRRATGTPVSWRGAARSAVTGTGTPTTESLQRAGLGWLARKLLKDR